MNKDKNLSSGGYKAIFKREEKSIRFETLLTFKLLLFVAAIATILARNSHPNFLILGVFWNHFRTLLRALLDFFEYSKRTRNS